MNKVVQKTVTLSLKVQIVICIVSWLAFLFKVPEEKTITIGFYLFYENFKIVKSYQGTYERNKILYNYMIITWSMYGIAGRLPSNIKNVSYNTLDIVEVLQIC